MAKLSRLMLLASLGIVLAALLFVGQQYPYICLLLLAVVVSRRAGRWRGSGNYGTARLATIYDLVRHRLVGGDVGLIMGRASGTDPPTRWEAISGLVSPFTSSGAAVRMFLASLWGRGDNSLIRIRDYIHILTVAPSGSGKGTSALIPNLLDYAGSVVVTDPMGELYRKTAKQRQAKGQRIIRLDPFGLAGPAAESDALNPFDFVDEKAMSFHDDVRSLTAMLVETESKDAQPHFNIRAMDVLATAIAFVCGCEMDSSKRTMILVRDLLSSPNTYREVISTMRRITGLQGVLSLLGDQLAWLKGRELDSVISTLTRHISWLNSPVVAACISRSTFEPRLLWGQKMTIYIIVPHDMMTTMAPLMRVWLGTLLRLVANNGRTEAYPVLFMIDEAAHLGRLRPLEDAITLLRGNGIRIWLFLQSLDQLKSCYAEKAAIMLDNMMTQQYFGITSLETADHLSKRVGDTTILVKSMNRNISYSRPTGVRPGGESSGSVSSSEGTTVNETARRLIKPEELLMQENALIFHRRLPPIAAHQVHYYNAPEFANGRTGKGRRVGFSAVLVASLALVASLVFARMMLALPSPDLLRQMAFAPGRRPAGASQPRFGYSSGGPIQPLDSTPKPPVSRPGELPLYYGDPLYGPAQDRPSSKASRTQPLGPVIYTGPAYSRQPLGPIIRPKGASLGR